MQDTNWMGDSTLDFASQPPQNESCEGHSDDESFNLLSQSSDMESMCLGGYCGVVVISVKSAKSVTHARFNIKS